ncbi:MAG: hypothetical protein AAGJ92_01310 [Pseudomonadota bacterium]
MSTLDEALLEAHERGDATALIGLYGDAADQAKARGDHEARYFYLTHALVFALEAGDARATDLRAQLAAAGREELLPDASPGPESTVS